MTAKSRNGQSLLEFALVLPLLLIVTFGIVEFGILMYDKAVITNASREGARLGIVARDRSDLAAIQSEIQSTVSDYAASYLITFGSGVGALEIPAPVFSGSTFGSTVTVTARYTYEFLVLPRLVASVTGPVVFEATTVMKLE